jgi:hypothetical protein
MQVQCDPLPLLEDGQATQLFVHPGVVDGEARVAGKGFDELLVIDAERHPVALVGQVQPADGSALDTDRHAKEGRHGRVPGRESHAASVGPDVLDAQRLAILDHDAKETSSLWLPSDGLAFLLADAGGDESLEVTVIVKDAERGVSRTSDGTYAVDDDLEDTFERELLADRDRGSIEGLEPSLSFFRRVFHDQAI